MNTPNPLVPQGTFAEKGKSHLRITVFAILAVHVVLLGLLLIAGCNKPDATVQDTGVPPVPPLADGWPPNPTSPPPATAVEPPPPVSPVASAPLAPVSPLAPVVTPPDVTSPAASGLTEHTIAKGDSFYTLGKKYGVGFKAIADANPTINPTRLKIGDKVKIPSKSSSAAAPSAVALENGDGRTYKVKSGDNLMKIAKTLGVSVKQLRTANNLRTDQIKVGQVLKVPAKTAPLAAPAAADPPPAVPPPGAAQ
jgi:LysM repeat protein